MTNYGTYPEHRFKRGTCIITFDFGYSWCMLSEKQKNYLAKSSYLSGARRVDIKLYNGKVFSLTIDQFLEWVDSGLPEPNIEHDFEIAPDTIKICPECGKAMVVRLARRGSGAGKQFWGCSGYPDCKHTESIENTSPEA